MIHHPFASAPMSPELERAVTLLVLRGIAPRPPLWRRLWRGVTRHFDHRYGEWWTTMLLLQLGVVLYWPPEVFSVSPGFAVMAQWATEEHWGLLCLLIGGTHLLALIVNGTFPRFNWSPHIRAGSSMLACFLWFQITLGISLSAKAPTGVGTYRLIFLLECWNFVRAMRDVGVVLGRRRATVGG